MGSGHGWLGWQRGRPDLDLKLKAVCFQLKYLLENCRRCRHFKYTFQEVFSSMACVNSVYSGHSYWPAVVAAAYNACTVYYIVLAARSLDPSP